MSSIRRPAGWRVVSASCAGGACAIYQTTALSTLSIRRGTWPQRGRANSWIGFTGSKRTSASGMNPIAW
jgi:hypothetical protein